MASVAEFIQCDSRNYTAGRQGGSVRKIVVHYTGTEASAHNNLLYFSRESAKASAHYFIDRDGSLRQSVSEGDTAWHAGHWATNLCSIGIEVVSGGSDFTEAQICTLADLVADLRGRYGIAAENVIRHYDVTGKLCPAPYVDGSKWAGLHARICGGSVSAGSGGSGGGSVSGDVGELAQRVIAGEFGNGDARKAALGSNYSAVQARVNEMLGCGSSGGSSGSSGGVDIDALARAVINGDYGNGEERKQRLGANYAAVQARVNEMLSQSGPAAFGLPASLFWVRLLADRTIRLTAGAGYNRPRLESVRRSPCRACFQHWSPAPWWARRQTRVLRSRSDSASARLLLPF